MPELSLEAVLDNNDAKMAVPLPFQPNQLVSNDLDIISRVQRESLPRDSSLFGYQVNSAFTDTLNNRLVFTCSDPRYYLDLLNSYFTADLSVIATNTGGTALKSFLDIGGVHSLIRSLTIRIGGSVLMRLDHYHKWYAVNSLVTHSPSYVDYNLAESCDSYADNVVRRPYQKAVTFTVAGSGYVTASGVLTLATTGLATTELQVGDELRIIGTVNAVVGTSQICRVQQITAATTAVVSGLIGYDVTAVTSIELVSRVFTASRANIMNQASAQRVAWRIPVGALSFLKHFPLPYCQDIAPLEIEFEFEQPQMALVLDNNQAVAVAAFATNKLGYKLSRCRFVQMLVEPSNKVREIHDMAYNGEGLWFPYHNVRHFQNKVASNDTDVTHTMQTNVSSARMVFSVLVDQTKSDSTGDTAQNFKSQSSFYRSSMNYYRYAAGSLQFPDYGSVNTLSIFAGEAWKALTMAFGINENTLHSSRIKPEVWQSTTSDRFIMAQYLAKDASFMSGVSLKNAFLELNINKTAEATNFNAHHFLYNDTALGLGRQSGIRIFD